MHTDTDRPKSQTAQTEEKILDFWQKHKIFQKSLTKPAPQGEFVFYEGPPTANGKPGIHHLEARAFKDIIPRYKTMRGFHVARKGGWDTHGLPVEIQVEKKLGLKSKKEVEAYGVEKFNKECKESVWEYVDLWEKFTDRIGYWVDQEHPYVTYEKTYMESVWNILKTVSEKKAGGVLGIGGKELLYKDYKVVPWCPRCGTALSSHELAQGYEDVKDLSVYVKFKVKGQENTYLLAWTTTPWTLPGNVGLAVGEKIDYVKFYKISEPTVFYIASLDYWKTLHGNTGADGKPEFDFVKYFKGAELADIEYQPLFPHLAQKFNDKDPEAFARAYQVYPADFVTTTDGTGIVHTAVMYGQEDFDLGTQVGLPKFHLVKDDGHFIDDMDFLSGRFVKEKNEDGKPTLDVDIITYLKEKSFFFKQENVKHTYPHCWRCKTPLIYYARDSWYIRMSALRDELVHENKKINWEPDHIKEGRFGEWLREVKDWAISRERYWGTPLPIWETSDGKRIVIGSVEELKRHIPKRNNYTLVRHAESQSNIRGEINCVDPHNDPLTQRGEEQARNTGRDLKNAQIDVIISSPFLRAQKTAQLIAEEIGFTGEIVTEDRFKEIQIKEWEGKQWTDLLHVYADRRKRFEILPSDSQEENWESMRARVAAALFDIDGRYEGKNILIVGHGGPLNLISLTSLGYSREEMMEYDHDGAFQNAEARTIDWRNLPHNDRAEIDLHKPFIDTVTLVDEQGSEYTRVKEVLDVWFDSGAMPFAQHHYPFEKDAKKLAYPADFISEAIDQTRGWFYTLHAIGVLMGKGHAYNNVVCLGHILDAQGKKMSKSLGNIIDPWIMIDTYGVDALRLWMYSVNRPGDSKNFDEQTVDEIVKKVFNPLTNIWSFYEMYADTSIQADRGSMHVLDRWIVARLDELVLNGTRNLDEFRVFEASRAIRDFVGDFSTWYIRRSRDRYKSIDGADKKAALQTTKYVLRELAKYMAPFTPFFAEDLYQKVTGGVARDGLESVHLEMWPESGAQAVGDVVILEDMQEVRTLVTKGLELRNAAGIKVRQPLARVTVKHARLSGRTDLLELVQDELNVKEILFNTALDTDAMLDTNITEELKAEGQYREILRAIQDNRKKEHLEPRDMVRLIVHTDDIGRALIEQFRESIEAAALVKEIVYGPVEGDVVNTEGVSVVLKVQKVI